MNCSVYVLVRFSGGGGVGVGVEGVEIVIRAKHHIIRACIYHFQLPRFISEVSRNFYKKCLHFPVNGPIQSTNETINFIVLRFSLSCTVFSTFTFVEDTVCILTVTLSLCNSDFHNI